MRLEIRAQRRNEMLAQLIARPLGPPGIPRLELMLHRRPPPPHAGQQHLTLARHIALSLTHEVLQTQKTRDRSRARDTLRHLLKLSAEYRRNRRKNQENFFLGPRASCPHAPQRSEGAQGISTTTAKIPTPMPAHNVRCSIRNRFREALPQPPPSRKVTPCAQRAQ
jgi:hypothetical protein